MTPVPKPGPRGPKPSRPIQRRAPVPRKSARRKNPNRMPVALAGGLALRQAREKLADELWRRIIWSKAPDGRCARCRLPKGLQAMHIFSRRFKAGGLRWDLDNGIPGCPGCHHYLGHDYEAHRRLAIRYVGAPTYARLELMKDGRGKADMLVVLMYLWAEASKRALPVANWRTELAKKIEAAA